MAKHTGIRKLPSGKFRARYFEGFDAEGKARYPAKTFDTQAEAVQWRAEHISAKVPGRMVEGRGLTVGEFLEQWLVIKKPDLREVSWATYRQYIDLYIKPDLGSIRLTMLSAKQIAIWQASLRARVSATTVAFARGVLNGGLTEAVSMETLRSNPMANTRGPKLTKPEFYPLTVEEALRLMEACEGAKRGLFFVMALNTGLRPEELIGLQWANVELGTRGVVRVKKVIHYLKGGAWRWHDPKTKSGVRSVVFDVELVTRLEAHRRRQLEERMAVGRCWKKNDLVFSNAIGEPLKQRALRYVFKVLLEKAKLSPEIRPYDCRHFFATSSLLAGVDAKTVSKEMGHSNVSFTLDTYGHVLEEMHESASDKRAELMRSRGGKS